MNGITVTLPLATYERMKKDAEKNHVKNFIKIEHGEDIQRFEPRVVIQEDAIREAFGRSVAMPVDYSGRIKEMNQVLEIQGETGNWDHSEYMLGLYNGMEMLLSIAEEREPVFRSLPGIDEKVFAPKYSKICGHTIAGEGEEHAD